MTKFNPDNKDVLAFGECLGPAMEITDQSDADQYLAEYVAYTRRMLERKPRRDGKTAEAIVKINLGYYAGYYDNETRERVERLFVTTHPIFGSIREHEPTCEEAFEAGMKLAKERP